MSAAPNIPDEETAKEARTALRVLSTTTANRSRHVTLRAEAGAGTVSVTVPRQAFDLFVEVLGQMSKGNAVTIVPIHAELTTQQAADMLNVSRPFVIELLEAGSIPYRKVGSHRRIRAADLIEYQRREEGQRRKMLDKLTAEAEDLGLGY